MRSLLFGGAALFLVGTVLSAFGSTHSSSSSNNQQTAPDYPRLATELCQDTLDPDGTVTFDPNPTVVRDGLAFKISGDATVGPNRTSYSCTVVLQGDKLVMSRSGFGQ